MKTNDLIQLGALALVGWLAYEKFAKAKQQPSRQAINTPLDPDFGITNPSDPTWGDATGATPFNLWSYLEDL